MSLFLIGKDYKSADIEIREGLYRNKKSIQEYFSGVSILATCNRFEIYGQGRIPQTLPPLLQGAQIINDRASIFKHALGVASGIESQVKGETQILEQLTSWLYSDDFVPEILQLWSKAVREAKEIRLISGLNDMRRNIATAIFGILERKKDKVKIIVAGTGKVAQLFCLNRPEWATIDFASHKNRKQAELLANQSQGEVFSFNELTLALINTDILISASSSPHLIFKKEYLEGIISVRRDPLVIFDLAIPRDIDPTVIGSDGLTMYDLDGLSEAIKGFNSEIKPRVALAEYLIEEKVGEYEKNVENRLAGKPIGFTSG